MTRRVAAVLAGLVVAVAGAVPAGASAFSASATASQSDSSATLDAPGSIHCTSTIGILTPITFTWTVPTVLAGKATGPLSYSVDRQQNLGAWSTIASGVTATTYSDSPSGPLGTTWSYRVTAHYGNWTSPVSATVSGVYNTVALVTVLTACAP